MGNLNGLFNINVELTDRCNKSCWICGRRKRERENPDLKLYYGDIDFELLERISGEVPSGIFIQFHNNGESLLYPRFGDAVKLFKHCITNVVTNGKLIYKKYDEIIDNLDTISVSIIEDDLFWQLQLYEIELFLQKKRDRKPFTTLRFVGEIDEERYKHFDLLKVRRVLHSPDGSFDYTKRTTIPEHGICEDLLHHLAINRLGDVSVCVRFDPQKELVLGNIKEHTLEELWNSEKRLEIRKLHIAGKRHLVPFCNKCHFYGVPTGY